MDDSEWENVIAESPLQPASMLRPSKNDIESEGSEDEQNYAEVMQLQQVPPVEQACCHGHGYSHSRSVCHYPFLICAVLAVCAFALCGLGSASRKPPKIEFFDNGQSVTISVIPGGAKQVRYSTALSAVVQCWYIGQAPRA